MKGEVLIKVLVISNGHSSSSEGVEVSGGDMRWIEIVKRWQGMDHEIHIFTTKSGKEICLKMGLNAEFHILNYYSNSIVGSYIDRSFKSSFCLPSSLKLLKPDLIYSVTEHYYDVVPAIILKKKQECEWKSVVHWVAPLKRNGKLLHNLLFYIQQRVGLYLIRKFADEVLAVSPSTKSDLIHKLNFSQYKVQSVECGVDLNLINVINKKLKDSPKKFDAVFMKRFHPAKGIFDTVHIWKKVVEKKPDAKLLMIGGGSDEIKKELVDLIQKNNLSENIIIKGVVYDIDEKFKLLSQSKVFMLPTHEENWAIVIGEALATGLPVVCYDIPEIKPLWKKHVFWIPKYDINLFSEEILRLIDNEKLRHDLAIENLKFVKKYSWDQIADNEITSKLGISDE